MPKAWIAFAIGICALWFSGCGRVQPVENATAVRAEYLAVLPGLRGSTHVQLQQAYRELESTRQLAATSPRPDDSNPYQGWEDAYPALSRSGLQREVHGLWPVLGSQLSPGGLEQARRIVPAQEASRQRFRRALDSLTPQPLLARTHFLQNGTAFLDAACVGTRIEGLAGFEAVAEGAPGEALPMLRHMLRVSQQLAREPDLPCRLIAARLRSDGLQLLAAIVNHPGTTAEIIAQVQQTLGSHTGDWPADEQVMIAEREHGLLVYELVRAGQYAALLPSEQRVELERQGLLSATEAAALKQVDQDQLFYLQAMSLQITVARLPYVERETAISQLQQELEVRRETGDYPLVAGSLLLVDVAEIHRQLAEDRCRCEAWLIALAAVQNQSLGAPPPCPMTGQSYELQIARDEVAIVNLPWRGETTIRIRRPGVLQAQRRAAGFDLR